jgi:hypothetical protein
MARAADAEFADRTEYVPIVCLPVALGEERYEPIDALLEDGAVDTKEVDLGLNERLASRDEAERERARERDTEAHLNEAAGERRNANAPRTADDARGDHGHGVLEAPQQFSDESKFDAALRDSRSAEDDIEALGGLRLVRVELTENFRAPLLEAGAHELDPEILSRELLVVGREQIG